jgi:hypothetical protein
MSWVVIKDSMLMKFNSEWEPLRNCDPLGSIWGPVLFLIYINDFSPTLSKITSSILFVGDMSIIIFNSNVDEFKNSIDLAMEKTIVWF